jgi:type I restriction enzyme R subunit
MAKKEAKVRIKINKLLEDAEWRFFDGDEGKANILPESNVKLTKEKLNIFGESFENTSKVKKLEKNFILLSKINLDF